MIHDWFSLCFFFYLWYNSFLNTEHNYICYINNAIKIIFFCDVVIKGINERFNKRTKKNSVLYKYYHSKI